MAPSSNQTLQRMLINGLRPLARQDARESFTSVEEHAPPVSTFVAHHCEKITEQTIPASGLIIVIEGRKELFWGGYHRAYAPGEAFILPAGAFINVINNPDDQSGVYRGLFIRFSGRLLAEAAVRWPHLAHAPLPRDPSVTISPALCSALIHCGEVLNATTKASSLIVDHRLLEVLLLLAEQGKLPLSLRQPDIAVADSVRLLVRNRPGRPWNAAMIAKALSMSEATLRRRLHPQNQTLRDLILNERMIAAHEILLRGNSGIVEAATEVGYASRSHFARHFYKTFGIQPSAVRVKAGIAPL